MTQHQPGSPEYDARTLELAEKLDSLDPYEPGQAEPYLAVLEEWREHIASHPRVIASSYPFKLAPPVHMNAEAKFTVVEGVKHYGWLLSK